MPTYEYKCTECSYEFEEFQKITDPAIEKCPKCNGKVQKKIGIGAGVLFKGSGFYVTDYKKNSTPKNETDGKKEEGKKSSAKEDKK